MQRFVDGDRLRFADGLSGLFDASRQPLQSQPQQQQGSIRSGPAMGSGRPIPMRGPASPRAPPPPSSPLPTAGIPSPAKSSPPRQKQLHISGQGITTLNQLENDILSIIQSIPKPNRTNETDEDGQDDEDGNDILLILDQPDLILATTPGIDANDMSEWVMGLQQVRFPPCLSFKDKKRLTFITAACFLDDNNDLRRLPAHPQRKSLRSHTYRKCQHRRNAPREESCLLCGRIGASRGYGATVTHAGYGGREGCKWCFEDESGWGIRT